MASIHVAKSASALSQRESELMAWDLTDSLLSAVLE